MGTGLGAGIVINGGAYEGVSGNAGELGHMCLEPDGPECWCGARGCAEVLAGPGAVVAAAQANADIAHEAGLDGLATPGEDRATVAAEFAAVTRIALRGHAGARRLLEDSAQYVAIAARSLANVLDLDLVVLTGPSLAVAGRIYQPIVQSELDRSFFSRATTHGVTVLVSPVARTSAAVGAAAMVLQSELVPQRSGLRLPGGPEIGAPLAPV